MLGDQDPGTPGEESAAKDVFSGAFAAALDAVIVIDENDRILEFNPAATQVFGYTREQAVGSDLAELIVPPPLRARHRAALAHHVATGHKTILDRRIELQAQKAGGATFPVELTVTRIEGRKPRFVAFLRDLTERRAMEVALAETEQRYKSLIDELRDYAIFMMDTDRRATSWNRGVERVLGYTEAEFLGLDVVPAIFTPEDVAGGVADREFDTARRLGTASNDRWMMRRDGTRFFALGVTLARRARDGALLGYAKIMRDRTDQKQLEVQLRDTAQKLAQANRRQRDFLAVLSHELRNPLAPIRNGIGILRLAGGSEETSEKVIRMMDRQVAHLAKLVDELLDMSRVNTGRISLSRKPLDLVQALRHAIEVAQSHCAGHRVRLVARLPRDPIVVDGDATRITQIFSNLLHNACKFTPADGHVEVGMHAEGAWAVATIRDTGIGIQPEHLERIFEMFEQLEESSDTKSGLGIGLALTKSLVELHGGSIEASSGGANQGSQFEVRLPLAAAGAGDREP